MLHFRWLKSRTCASLALYMASFLLNDMPFRKGQFYGVIKKVYLRLWNCRSQDQTNCSLHSLVTVEGLFAQATYPPQSVQVTFAPQNTSWETRSDQVPREVETTHPETVWCSHACICVSMHENLCFHIFHGGKNHKAAQNSENLDLQQTNWAHSLQEPSGQ